MRAPLAILSSTFLLTILFLSSCSESPAIFVGESEPDGFVISFQKPELFEFEIPKTKDNYKFALELTYYSEQMQNMMSSIPLYYILEGPGLGDGKDKKFSLDIKEENGDWRGELLPNEHDRKFEQIFEESISLEAGKHSLKLYADSQKQGEPVQGIVRVTFKVY